MTFFLWHDEYYHFIWRNSYHKDFMERKSVKWPAPKMSCLFSKSMTKKDESQKGSNKDRKTQMLMAIWKGYQFQRILF